MKTLFLSLFTIILSSIAFSQNESFQNAMNEFQESYNSEKYDEIYSRFSQEMKDALPIASAKMFFKNLKNQYGKITDKEFVGYPLGPVATYKTEFEKITLAVNISVDENNLINGLSITPFDESTIATNHSVNQLKKYPKEISEIIFSKVKNFPNNTQLSIAVTENGKTSYYGVIKTKDKVKPIKNQDKVFEIGSITKVFTSTVLAALVENEKIKLTDEINSYFSFPFKDDIKLTFKGLATHTSGLPRLPDNLDLTNESNPYKEYGVTLLNEYLENYLELKEETENSYLYSNLGTALLGYTLGLSQNTNFQELLQKMLFDKYQMTNSFMSSDNLKKKLVKGQKPNGEITSNWDFDVLFAAGGVLSTTNDLTAFAKAQFDSNNKELLLTRTPLFDVSPNMKIGLGWHLLKSKKGKDLVWHNGATGGYTSSMTVNVKDQISVVILSNLSGFHPEMRNIDGICFELMEWLEGE